MSKSAHGALGAWGNRTTFVLALSAAAIGLGSLWRFAWLVGTHGGGAFVISYVICLFLVAVPIMAAEVVLGSYGRASPALALRWTADRSLLSRQWMWLGVLACLAGLLVLSYQAVVAGWSLAYVRYMGTGQFAAASAEVVSGMFRSLLENTQAQLRWQSLFLVSVAVVIALGRRGLALLVWLVIPVIIALLAMLLRYALDNGNLAATRDFMFSVKMVDFSTDTVLAALGHALLTLGAGTGAGIMYGAYAPRRIPLGRSVMAVAVFDTLIALLAGIVIFPVVMANNMEPAVGPGLLFLSVPYAFGNLLHGELFGALFFLLTLVAALGSAVALLEPTVASLVQHTPLRRPLAAAVVTTAVWVLAWRVSTTLGEPGWFGTHNLLAFLDQLAAGLLLPLVSLLTAIYVGWRLRAGVLRPQMARESNLSFSLWRGLLRYIAPLAIAVFAVMELVS